MAERTAVEFRTGVRDKRGYALRWLQMAAQRGARVRVLGSPTELQALSQLLWVADKESFLPHALTLGAAPLTGQGLERTPVWLGAGPVAGEEPPLLLNLCPELPSRTQGYERIIDVVSADEAEVQAGRERWAGYKRLGLSPAHRKSDDEASGGVG
jgi:DNA polymerase III subunit chi